MIRITLEDKNLFGICILCRLDYDFEASNNPFLRCTKSKPDDLYLQSFGVSWLFYL